MWYACRRVLCLSFSMLLLGPGFLLGQSVISSWTTTTPLPQGCAGAGAASHGSHLIVLCGSPSGNSTYVGEVDGSGNVLSWSPTLPLPSTVHPSELTRIGEHLIVPFPGNSYVGKLGANGSILSWTPNSGTLNPAINGRAVASDGNRVYSVGGGLGGSIYADVEMAALDANGVLSSWQSLIPLPVPIHDPQATVIGDYLYVFGGESAGGGLGVSSDVRRAAILSDGTIGPWEFVGLLKDPRPHAGHLRFGAAIHVVAGGVHGYMTASVESALESAIGNTVQHIYSQSLPTILNEFGTAVVGSFGYVIGGNNQFFGGSSLNTVYVASLGPVEPPNSTPTLAAGLPIVSVNEGLTALNSGTYSDLNSADDVTISASVGSITKTGTNSGSWSWSFATIDGPAQNQSVTISADDGNGGTSMTIFSLIVNNVAPSIPGVGLTPTPLAENNTVTLSGLLSDTGILDTHTVTINWGDGSLNSFIALPAGQLSFGATHLYPDDGPTNTPLDTYAITISAIDKDNGTGAVGTFLPVNNVPPVITTVSGPINPTALGTPTTIIANFTDAGLQDTHTCTFSWNDGQAPTNGTVTETAGSGSCTDTRTYTAAGVYTVVVTAQDDDTGNTTKEFEFVVVYDPTGGFVTGGGWINSPAGAYRADLTLTGKANFGFVSKYQNGASVPTGSTEFQFKTENFSFSSTAYDWLVIGGARAQYKGTGTINGGNDNGSGYGFMLTAIDGQVSGGGGIDKFRIKIWKKSDGTIVYDNQVGSGVDGSDTSDPVTAVGGGNIVIHKN